MCIINFATHKYTVYFTSTTTGLNMTTVRKELYTKIEFKNIYIIQ